MSVTSCFQLSNKFLSTSLKNGVTIIKKNFSFELNSTQKEVQSLARKFFREEVAPTSQQYDRSMELPLDWFKKSHKVGLRNVSIPKKYGGLGMGEFEASIVIEEAAWACVSYINLEGANQLAANPLLLAGNEEQKKKYLTRLTAEPIFAACAITEASTGSDVNGIKTRAVKKGDEYILNGEKMWISNAGVASWYVVLARTHPDPNAKGKEAFTFFIVERDSPGLTPGRKEINMGLRAADTRGITFEDVRIPKENVLRGEGAGWDIAMTNFDRARVPAAVGSVGLAQRCLDEAASYSLVRKTFGKLISEHQTVSNKLANMAMEIETARLLGYQAAWLIDHDRSKCRKVVSMAKAYCSEVANRCASEAVQIFGGAGFNTDYPVEKLMRDAKILQIFDGTSEIQRIIIARELLKEYK